MSVSATLHVLLPGLSVREVPLSRMWSWLAPLRDLAYARPERPLPARVERGVLGLKHHHLPPGTRRLDLITVDEWRAFARTLDPNDSSVDEVQRVLDHFPAAQALIVHFPHEPEAQP